MKTYYIYRIQILCTAFLLFLFACKGKGEDPAPSKKDLLSKDWQLIKLTVNNASPVSALSQYSFKFNKDGSYQITSAEPAISQSGTWQLNSNETKIILNGGTEEFLILALTAQQMVLEFTSKNYKTGNVLWQFEFK